MTLFSAGLGVISNPLGALIGGTLAELFGRRMTLLIAAFPYVVGWLLISVSTDLYWLGAGRFVTGFAVSKTNQVYFTFHMSEKP
jgi:MFS family permease